MLIQLHGTLLELETFTKYFVPIVRTSPGMSVLKRNVQLFLAFSFGWKKEKKFSVVTLQDTYGDCVMLASSVELECARIPPL